MITFISELDDFMITVLVIYNMKDYQDLPNSRLVNCIQLQSQGFQYKIEWAKCKENIRELHNKKMSNWVL